MLYRLQFWTRSVYTRNFEHLNKVGVRATIEKQRSVIKFLLLLLEGEIPCHIFQRLQKVFFSKVSISCSTFYFWVLKFTEGRTSVRDKPSPGKPAEAVTPYNGGECWGFCRQNSQNDITGVANQLSISKTLAHPILHVKISNGNARRVPKRLTKD